MAVLPHMGMLAHTRIGRPAIYAYAWDITLPHVRVWASDMSTYMLYSQNGLAQWSILKWPAHAVIYVSQLHEAGVRVSRRRIPNVYIAVD